MPKKTPEIIIEVSGGVATVTKRVRGIAVDIVDFDVEGCADDELCHCKRGQGAPHEHRI